MSNQDNNLTKKLDYTLIFIVFLLMCVSIISIYYSPFDSDFIDPKSIVIHQIIWYVIAAIVAFAIYLFDYDRLRQLHWILYGLGMVLLFGLTLAQFGFPIPFADESNGALSWYQLPGIGSLQPSEFMKIFLMITLAQVITKHNEQLAEDGIVKHTFKDDFILLGKMAAVSFPPIALVLIQPDLGTVTIMAAIVFIMFFVSGIEWRIVTLAVLLLVLGLAFFFYIYFTNEEALMLVLKGHQLDRFDAWLDPYHHGNDIGYQFIQGITAIGSGLFYGRGVDSFASVPEGYTDFIFTTVAGKFGFLGAAILISLFFLLIYRIIYAALKTHDPFGSYICAGVIGMLTFQIFENIGMTLQLMPITGITLPFISYGGSSLLTCMIAIGLILNIESRIKKYMFD